MIETVYVKNSSGQHKYFWLKNPFYSGWNVKNIEGLTPGEAIINTSPTPGWPGSMLNSTRFPERQITFDIEFMSEFGVEEARRETYKFFPITGQVQLGFETGNGWYYIDGVVKSNTANIFSQKENTIITVLCPKPYFYREGTGHLTWNSFSSRGGGFEFPFSNESLTQKMLEFGTMSRTLETNMYYEGDVPATGVFIEIEAVGGRVINPVVRNTTMGNTMKFNVTLEAGDTLKFNSSPGFKAVWIVDVNNSTRLASLNILDRFSSWVTLGPGDNILTYSADNNSSVFADVRIGYTTLFSGI